MTPIQFFRSYDYDDVPIKLSTKLYEDVIDDLKVRENRLHRDDLWKRRALEEIEVIYLAISFKPWRP